MENLEQYYETLGLKPGVSLEQLRQAYKELIQVWHPDRFPNNPDLREKAEQKMREINEAYQYLQSYYRIKTASTSTASNASKISKENQTRIPKQNQNDESSKNEPKEIGGLTILSLLIGCIVMGWFIGSIINPDAGWLIGVFIGFCVFGWIFMILDEVDKSRIKKILKAKFNLDADGNALWIAVNRRDLEAIRLLRKIKVDMNPSNESPETPLIFSVVHNYSEIVESLLDKGSDQYPSAKIDAQNEFGETPLMLASIQGNIDMVKLLLKYGAKVNLKSKRGLTPLHYASELGYIEITHSLLQKSAEVNVVDIDGFTPLMYALAGNHVEIVALLKRSGAKG